eukprot:10374140-Alexandrium_andersonii.AAC.1
MALNRSLANTEKGPKFCMEEAAASAGPQGETSLFRARSRRKPATPSVAALRAGGAPRSVAPPARSAETS